MAECQAQPPQSAMQRPAPRPDPSASECAPQSAELSGPTAQQQPQSELLDQQEEWLRVYSQLIAEELEHITKMHWQFSFVQRQYRTLQLVEDRKRAWEVDPDRHPVFDFYAIAACPDPVQYFSTFIRNHADHPFSRLMTADSVPAVKRFCAACAAPDCDPGSWAVLTSIQVDGVPRSLETFRRLMTSRFVLQKLHGFMEAVGVPCSDADVRHAVDRFLEIARRGFCQRYSMANFLFGATLGADLVLICDDVKAFWAPERGKVMVTDMVTGQRVVTLLHEFANFFPLYMAACSPTQIQANRERGAQETKHVTFSADVVVNERPTEAGAMFERMLFGRAVERHATFPTAKLLLEWDGAKRLSLSQPHETLFSGRRWRRR